MSAYRDLADVYDTLFPARPERLRFARRLLPTVGGEVLDIGCATGGLALQLAAAGYTATAVDANPEMIRMASGRAQAEGLAVRFHVMDMRHVSTVLADQRFNLILCLGNTLVHLEDAPTIGAFLRSCSGLLSADGTLVLQHILSERHIAGTARPAPVLDKGVVRLSRSSTYLPHRHRVAFTTEIHHKDTGQTMSDTTQLYPLTTAELLDMLPACGLALTGRYADFGYKPVGPEDEAHIAVLRPV